jgi:LacI family transcriptional regulator
MNIKEIAKHAGVSVASVSRAFQNPPSPSLSERQRRHILDVCEKLHYYPDIHSQRMSSKRSNCIALMSHYLSLDNNLRHPSFRFDMNFTSVVMGIQCVLQSSNLSLQLTQVTEDFILERRHINMVRSKMFDAILVWGALYSDNFVRELVSEDIPVILVSTTIPDCNCSKITADEYKGMAAMTKSVIAAGHRKIAVVIPGNQASSGDLRKNAVLATLNEAGITPAWLSDPVEFNFDGAYAATERLLRKAPDVTCIIAPNDISAGGVIEALLHHGRRVPEDISVTGGDGVLFFGPLKLHSFYMPSYELGVLAAQTALRQINGEKIISHQIVPVNMIPGNSLKKLI